MPGDWTERLIKRENDAWNALRSTIEALQSGKTNVRAESVRDNVDKTVSCLISLGAAREAIHAELRARSATAPRALETGERNDTADRVTALESKVMNAIDKVQEKLESHGRALEIMASTPAPVSTAAPGTSIEDKWTEVVKRSRGGPKQKKLPEPLVGGTETKNRAHQRKQPRARPLAIAVSMAGEEFPELLKTVKRNVDPQVTGDSITKMRRTQKGELLIEVRGGADSANKIRAEVARSLGAAAKIRRLESTSPIEI